MAQQLQLVTLAVADLERSRRFYSDGLGWTPLFAADEVVFYQVGHGVMLALFRQADFVADVGAEVVTGVGTTGYSLAQILPRKADVDALAEAAVASGGTLLKPPQLADFGGYHCYFADPDGHRWEIAVNPGFSVAADGTVSLRPIRPGELDDRD